MDSLPRLPWAWLRLALFSLYTMSIIRLLKGPQRRPRGPTMSKVPHHATGRLRVFVLALVPQSIRYLAS